MDNHQHLQRLKIPHSVMMKAPGLLPMLYKVSELADELDLSEPTLRMWLEKGVPYHRDASGHIWINGEIFAHWIAEQVKAKTSVRLSNDQGYCFRCKVVMQIRNPEITQGKGKQILIRGTCSVCGTTINRGGCIGKSR